MFRGVNENFIQNFSKRLITTPQKRIMIGITGESASGKSTICRALSNIIQSFNMPVTVLTTDNYFKDISSLIKQYGSFDSLRDSGYDVDSPENMQLEVLKNDLTLLSQGKDVYAPEYLPNGTGVSIPNVKWISSNKIIVVEGIATMYEGVKDIFDIKVYVETKDYKNAKDSIDNAIKINPNFADSYYTLGLIYENLADEKANGENEYKFIYYGNVSLTTKITKDPTFRVKQIVDEIAVGETVSILDFVKIANDTTKSITNTDTVKDTTYSVVTDDNISGKASSEELEDKLVAHYTFELEGGIPIDVVINYVVLAEGNIDVPVQTVGTTFTQLKDALNGKNIKLFEKDGTTVANGNLKTGQIIKYGSKSYDVIVKGDTNGDGKVGYVDYVLIYNHIYKTKNF